MADNRASDFTAPHQAEAIKTYSTFDGTNRLEFFYVATVHIVAGQKCQVTQYVYDGSSSRVVKTKESLATWQAAWDI